MFAELENDEISSVDLGNDGDPRVHDFFREFELNDETIPFVGRRRERELIKSDLKLYCSVVALHGPPLVGKSRLAKQVFLELLQESLDMGVILVLRYVNLDINDHSNLTQRVYQVLSQNGGKDFEYSLDDVVAQLNTNTETHNLILFDNCDTFLQEMEGRKRLIEVCSSIIKRCKKTKIMITSRGRFNLASRLGKRYRCANVTSLPKADAVELLQLGGPSVDLTEHAEELTDNCCGLPSVLFLVGTILEERQSLLTPKELCELFEQKSVLEYLNTNIISDDFSIRDQIAKSFKSISACLQRYYAALSYIPGQFTAEAASAIIQSDTVVMAKERALIPLVDRGILEYSETTKSFHMHPILRTFAAQTLRGVLEADCIRERFVKYFGQCLIDVSQKFESTSHNSEEQGVEMEKIQLLLQEAIHCKENVYPVFYQVATKAWMYLSITSPRESIAFYDACRHSAKRFGTPEEEGRMLACYGDLKLEHASTRADECVKIFDEALDLLRPYSTSDALSSLLSKYSWLYYRTGKYHEAVRCCEKAMKIEIGGGRGFSRELTKILSLAGISLTMLGQYEKSERYLREALDMRVQMNPHHPGVAPALNNLGGLYTKWGKREKGLNFSKASLMQRRHHYKKPHNDLARGLVSVAYQVLRLHGANGADEALGYLKEAMTIREKLGYNHQNTAYILYYMGEALAHKKHYKQAVQNYSEALAIHEKCLGTFSYFKEKVQINIGCILQEAGEFEKATTFLAPILKYEKRSEITAREPKYEILPKAALAMYKIQCQVATPCAIDYRLVLKNEVERLAQWYIKDKDVDNLNRLRNNYYSYLHEQLSY